jgi:phosphatidylserine decarboxylase
MFGLLRFVPKNHLSYFVGRLAFLRLPRAINRLVIRLFADYYGVATEEASLSLDDYHSLGEFFIRDLRPDARPIGNGIVSPVDGVLSEFGLITAGHAVQVKGRKYPVAKLLGDPELGALYDQGFYLTFYLAPGDYHHIHAPVAGVVTDAHYMPGKLWPVNSWSLNHIEELYCVNERITTVIRSEKLGRVCVVKVGATNVGSIRLSYDTLRANQRPRFYGPPVKPEHRRYSQVINVAKAQRIGTFCLGSTVVVLFEPGKFTPGENCKLGPVKMGASLS